MPLDPAAERFIASLAGTPPTHTLTPEAVRASRVAGPPGPEVARVMDMAMAGPEGPVPVRIYWPSDEQGLPALVWYHGGGWVLGNLDLSDATARELCMEAGCVVISVDYRLAPEHPFPAALVDAYVGPVWVVQNAPRIGVDPARVAIGGDSAGGNLAAVIARQLRDRGGPTIVHQLLVYPVIDCAMDTASYAENSAYSLSRESMEWFYDHYCPAGIDRAAPDVSPIRAASLAGLAPATVIVAEYDPLRDEGLAYARALEAAGVPVTARLFEGQIHGFFNRAHLFPAAHDAIAFSAVRLREAFGTA